LPADSTQTLPLHDRFIDYSINHKSIKRLLNQAQNLFESTRFRQKRRKKARTKRGWSKEDFFDL
jgi:hypothetical protein